MHLPTSNHVYVWYHYTVLHNQARPVVGTGNRIEDFCRILYKIYDGGVDISLIADLYKSEV